MELFKAEDFIVSDEHWIGTKMAAHIANRIFREWLEKQPVVYGRITPDQEWFDESGPSATHTARLVCVEPIKRDTAVGLLRELTALNCKAMPEGEYWTKLDELDERARALLRERGS